ncbi:MAG: transglycosylase SLT domain-containing protein [Rhizobiaceae bacterium]|nr:transglycosylase SLT domain-containing protein [Rhizobiaceae bacterium]
MKTARAAVLLAAGLLLSSCMGIFGKPGGPGGGPDVVSDPPPAAFAMTARWDDRPDGARWTAFTLAALDAHGAALVASTPSDIALYCPKYATAAAEGRKAFWVGLLSALTKWESSYNPATSFLEPGVFDASGNRVTSRGLLQISIESGRGYGCQIANEQALHDPEVNLTCAVRIFNRLVVRDGIIGSNALPWTGASAYWSPFRDQSKRKDIRDWTKAQSYCAA